MGALREGIGTVILPSENLPDLEEIDQTVRAQLKFIPASRVETVLENALLPVAEAEELPVTGSLPAGAPVRLPLGQ